MLNLKLIVLGWDEAPQCDCVSTLSALLITHAHTHKRSLPVNKKMLACSELDGGVLLSLCLEKQVETGSESSRIKAKQMEEQPRVSERGSLCDVLVHFHSFVSALAAGKTNKAYILFP